MFPCLYGGLGIGKLDEFDKVLIRKCIWRFGVERDSWWRSIIAAKYEESFGGLED